MKLVVDIVVFLLALITRRERATIFNIFGWILVGQTIFYAQLNNISFLSVLVVIMVVAVLTNLANFLADKTYENFKALQDHLGEEDENSQSGG